jgi:O-antigen ligase
MTASSATSPVSPVWGAYRLREIAPPWHLLFPVLLCTIPAAVFVFLGSPLPGARYLVFATILVLGYYALTRQIYCFATVGVGFLPMVLLLRGVFFYYGVLAILGATLILFLRDEVSSVLELWNDRAWRYLALFGVLFWWLSVLITGDKSANLRIFELVLGSGAVVLLARKPSHLAVALFGMWISTNLLAIGMLPYGDRLGLAEIDETRLGNPILVGIPSASLLVISLADGGQWMLLQKRKILGIAVPLMMAQWLILSGSRGSWIMALSALTLLLLIGARDRKVVFALAGLGALVVSIWSSTSRGTSVAEQFSKTLDTERSLANRTSGRSEQWKAIPYALAESPVWGWGPGTGKDVAWKYTGRHLGWHALYLQMMGETGLAGVAAMLAFLGTLIYRGVRHRLRCRENLPLLCAVAYIVIGASVSAMDATCGVLVGLALLGRGVVPRVRARPVREMSRNIICQSPRR